MATYSINQNCEIEIDFHGIVPDVNTRNKMKAVKIWWNPQKKVWHGPKNEKTLAVANELCKDFCSKSSTQVRNTVSSRQQRDCALKLKIKDIVDANPSMIESWEKTLKNYVNEIMGEDNITHSCNAVNKSQETVWINCFKFIKKHLRELSHDKQEFELIFEYSIPGTVHERPDVLLITSSKVISLEFKKKNAPQVDDNKDDVAQAIRYKKWIENYHKVTKEKELDVKSYLVCTHEDAVQGNLRGIKILTKDNFLNVIESELEGESECIFIDDWLTSAKTEMPDMLRAMEIMYRAGKIPYITDVNKKCLKKVLDYIFEAKKNHKKLLIMINGVPGAGKTAVGQSVVFEENKDGLANAVYLSGNGPLVEVLQYQINTVGNNNNIGANAIQEMKKFKGTYFSNKNKNFINTKVPEQNIIVFDEAQRAWDIAKMNRGLSEPEGLFDVCERIYDANKNKYVVLICLYGNGQVIHDGEEAGLSLWENALKQYTDWSVIASKEIAHQMAVLEERKIQDNDLFLPVSLRADFVDCSKWVEQAIGRSGVSFAGAQKELLELQKTSMRIFVTRDIKKVCKRIKEINVDHPDWKYGIYVSNFAEKDVIQRVFSAEHISYNGEIKNSTGEYGRWYTGECKHLKKSCSVFGAQGLELDCPIVLFGCEYVRRNGIWVTGGKSYNYNKKIGKYRDIDTIVENNFRVLLTRARKEIILLIPKFEILDETYKYFIDMGMDVL